MRKTVGSTKQFGYEKKRKKKNTFQNQNRLHYVYGERKKEFN